MPDQLSNSHIEPAITMDITESSSGWRLAMPQQILACLPLTLFFPVGVMYLGVLLFYISLLVSGNFSQKLQVVRASPMLWPVLTLSAVSIVIALIHNRPAGEFWSGFFHYQTYLFLLPFLSVGAGVWQQKALKIFFAGAIFAATLYYLNFLHVLPNNTMFRSYVVYEGNKSILLGVLLALSSAWMLHELLLRKDHKLVRIVVLIYVVAALMLLAKTRTASVTFVLLCLMIACRNLRWSWRSAAILGCLIAGFAGAWQYVVNLPAPATCVVNEMQQTTPVQILLTRAECTVHQIHSFGQGKSVGDDGMRLEIYKVTSQIIAEQPWTGHGIANWMPLYQERAKSLRSGTMTTPHNDYLLYFTELGIAGVAALLWIWCTQLQVAYRMRASPNDSDRAMLLAMLGMTMMIGGMFNAILRDGVFGMAFMILLAIPLAGVGRSNIRSNNESNIKNNK
ncbi:O-antigen ligase family protein [Undibacterium sp. RTI2.1]|uniref:O-antigen ligase family protein n=1 Tax=unclassified Undibacterium TaxID=2630295 RepID=UPI002AB40CF8|nr:MULTISPECIES: O-antigen ligase family protein [unclassified Undibacterium]MDY7538942.1 O-antigen ligase family protein [Undibacterium sp. 5I1]MEB0032418.1 O-antigen ligase family protein [Undibacterium sp. RTI2.1]MEB0118607.1 O-antigen ligase family protein [Undibacterium sp. RTI2.2]MEB0232216.1 O-antigen ligase family protein [Undibacterium sp. 10I3]MEB0259737.1 O-antigen ligase family protein [Undibacterium sp. 5I1]